jgi:hypothetical protein
MIEVGAQLKLARKRSGQLVLAMLPMLAALFLSAFPSRWPAIFGWWTLALVFAGVGTWLFAQRGRALAAAKRAFVAVKREQVAAHVGEKPVTPRAIAEALRIDEGAAEEALRELAAESRVRVAIEEEELAFVQDARFSNESTP